MVQVGSFEVKYFVTIFMISLNTQFYCTIQGGYTEIQISQYVTSVLFFSVTSMTETKSVCH